MSNLNSFIEETENQIAFEKERGKHLTEADKRNGWSKEYLAGYIDGLQQAVDVAKLMK